MTQCVWLKNPENTPVLEEKWKLFGKKKTKICEISWAVNSKYQAEASKWWAGQLGAGPTGTGSGQPCLRRVVGRAPAFCNDATGAGASRSESGAAAMAYCPQEGKGWILSGTYDNHEAPSSGSWCLMIPRILMSMDWSCQMGTLTGTGHGRGPCGVWPAAPMGNNLSGPFSACSIAQKIPSHQTVSTSFGPCKNACRNTTTSVLRKRKRRWCQQNF